MPNLVYKTSLLLASLLTSLVNLRGSIGQSSFSLSQLCSVKPEISGATAATDSSEALEKFLQNIGLSPNIVRVVNQEANLQHDIAAQLVNKAYSIKREVSNVHGRRGKRLDPVRMDLMRKMT